MDVQKTHENSPKNILLFIPISFGIWLFLTSTIDVLPSLGAYNGKRILELYLITLTLSLVLLNKPARLHFGQYLMQIPLWVRILILVFFGLGLISALRLPHPAYPLVDVAMLMLMLLAIIAVACSQHLLKMGFDRIALLFIAITGFGVFFQELIGLLVFQSSGHQFSFSVALAQFLHPRFYNHFQTWTIPLIALLPLVFKKHRSVNVLSIFLIGAQWYIVLSMGARGTTISLLMSMLIIGSLFHKTIKYWLKIQILGLTLGIATYFLLVGAMNISQPHQSEFVSESVGRPMMHTSGRTNFWKYALADVKQNPLLGSGPMRFACGVNHRLESSPHSFPVQIISEWGVPAFLILGIVFTWLFFAWFQATKISVKKSDYRQAAVACLSISSLAAAIHINVSGLHIAPASQVAGVLVLGWLVSYVFGVKTSRNGASVHANTNLILVFGLLISISVLVFSTVELKQYSYRTSYTQENGFSYPRYWQDGRFCQYIF